MFEYFYNEILRRTIISFGTLFNGISVEQKNESDQTVSNIRVPLAYWFLCCGTLRGAIKGFIR